MKLEAFVLTKKKYIYIFVCTIDLSCTPLITRVLIFPWT
jgi:hypothetical protein